MSAPATDLDPAQRSRLPVEPAYREGRSTRERQLDDHTLAAATRAAVNGTEDQLRSYLQLLAMEGVYPPGGRVP